MAAKEDLEWRPLERVNPAFREVLERAYRANPERTHTDLMEAGYRIVAAQLKIDYQVGRLG